MNVIAHCRRQLEVMQAAFDLISTLPQVQEHDVAVGDPSNKRRVLVNVINGMVLVFDSAMNGGRVSLGTSPHKNVTGERMNQTPDQLHMLHHCWWEQARNLCLPLQHADSMIPRALKR